MQFRLLGPVAAYLDDEPIDLGTPQRRAVLAALLLQPRHLVSVTGLVAAVWDDAPPRTAVKNIQGHVYRLRRALAALPRVTLHTRSSGYLLDIDPDQVDLHRFRRLVGGARSTDDVTASAMLTQALDLWQGPALAGLDSTALHTVAAQLEEERLAARERLLEVQLRLGDHVDVLAELRTFVDAHPLREHARSLLMLALLRAGRRGDALTAYRQGRDMLARELGVEPGAELSETHRQVLRGDPPPTPNPPPAAPAASPRVAPAELPHAAVGFAGRASGLAELDALLTVLRDPDNAAAVIAAVDGMAGVGKTALAVHWAQRHHSEFPDGMLYVDLRGYDAHLPALSVAEALAQLLYGLGVPAEDIPPDPADRGRLFRSRIAAGRYLLVLDNAENPAQVRPLLPGTPTAMVIVTSRHCLTGLIATEGAHRLVLHPLTPDESEALLTRLLGRHRVAADRASATMLARLCGHLPLTLRVMAAHLSTRPDRSLAQTTTDLATGDRLSTLTVPDDPGASVAAALTLSYRALDPPAARLLRQLGAFPGVTFTADAAAALAGTDRVDVSASIRQLCDAHLVAAYTTDLYTMHELVRVFAAAQARTDGEQEQAASRERLLQWYVQSVRQANVRARLPRLLPLDPPAEDPTAPTTAFPDTPEAAMRWLEVERANLVAAVAAAAADGPAPLAWRLAAELRAFLRLRRHIPDWVATSTDGLRAAREHGGLRAQAALLHSLGHADWSTGDYRRAIDHYQDALSFAERAGWPDAVVACLSGLAAVHHELGHAETAAGFYEQALARCDDTVAPIQRLIAAGSLGLVYQSAGLFSQAIDRFTAALNAGQQLGATDAIATSLGNIGMCHIELGDLERSYEPLAEGLKLYRTVGSRNGEANILTALAQVNVEHGRLDDAAYQSTLALRLARDIGDRRIEVDALAVCGRTDARRDQFLAAHERLENAAELAEQIGYHRGTPTVLAELADVQLRMGQAEHAVDTARRAQHHAAAAGYRPVEATALTVLADAELTRGNYDAARHHADAAIEISQRHGLRLQHARARATLAAVVAATGSPN